MYCLRHISIIQIQNESKHKDKDEIKKVYLILLNYFQ